MLLWPRRLPFLQPSSQSRGNRPQPSDVTSFGPFPSPSLSQWTWKRTTPTFWCDSVSHAEFFCPTWKGLATKPLLWESVQTKPNLISRELIRKGIHVILRRPPSWKPDGSKGQTPPFPGGDPWRGIVKVINANIEEKMEKKRRAEVFDKSFLVDLGPREDETSARVLNRLVIVFMERL